MPVNMNRLIATYEVKLKPGVDSVSEAKTSTEAAEQDRVMRFLGITGCAKVHASHNVNKPLCKVQKFDSRGCLWCMVREFLVHDHNIHFVNHHDRRSITCIGYTVAWPFGHGVDHSRFITVHTSLDVSDSIITDPSG